MCLLGSDHSSKKIINTHTERHQRLEEGHVAACQMEEVVSLISVWSSSSKLLFGDCLLVMRKFQEMLPFFVHRHPVLYRLVNGP